MTRSKWKAYFVSNDIIKKFDEIIWSCFQNIDQKSLFEFNSNKIYFKNFIFEKAREKSSFNPIKIWSRKSVILPEFLGFTFKIYNGRSFRTLIIGKNMLFRKFGEFAITKKLGPNIHIVRKKKKKESKKKRR